MAKTPDGELITGEISADSGPAMKALANDMQRRFVLCLQNGHDFNYSRAALEAGYKSNGQSGMRNVYNMAYKLAHSEKIIAAIEEEAHRLLGARKGWTMMQYLNLGLTATTQGDKQKAFESILKMGGFGMTTKHDVTVTHKDERSSRELFLTYMQLAKQMGLAEPMKMLNAPAVDVEFTEVVNVDAEMEDL